MHVFPKSNSSNGPETGNAGKKSKNLLLILLLAYQPALRHTDEQVVQSME